jgi:hypothetical protein
MRINSVNYVTFPRTNVIIKCSHSGEACHNPSKDIDPSTSGDQKTTSKALYQKQAIGVQCPVPPSLLSKADTCHDLETVGEWTVLFEALKHLGQLFCLVSEGRTGNNSKSINSPKPASSPMMNSTKKIVFGMLVKMLVFQTSFRPKFMTVYVILGTVGKWNMVVCL